MRLLLALGAIFLAISYQTEISKWLLQGVGQPNLPMYVHLYPVGAALIAGSFAIYAALKAYSAALLNDKREREFRKDELARQRTAYACELFYDLGSLLAACKSIESIYSLFDTEVKKEEFVVIESAVDKETFTTAQEAIHAGWDIISCLEVETLRQLFLIRAETKFIEKTALLIKDSAKLASKYPKGAQERKECKQRIETYMLEIKKRVNLLERTIIQFREHLSSKYPLK